MLLYIKRGHQILGELHAWTLHLYRHSCDTLRQVRGQTRERFQYSTKLPLSLLGGLTSHLLEL